MMQSIHKGLFALVPFNYLNLEKLNTNFNSVINPALFTAFDKKMARFAITILANFCRNIFQQI